MRNTHNEILPFGKNSDILFFTSATGFYENFVIPYVYFAEKSNPGSKFEFIVNNADKFLKKNSDSLIWLEENMHVKPIIRSRETFALQPQMENSIRFITQPTQISKYVYIGDVDIMIIDNILNWHKPIFDAGLPYSNIIRKGTKKLSGLHLSKYFEYYPLPDIEDLIQNTYNDEELLYKIVERKGNLYETELYDALVKGRPVHGIHMSLSRLPFSAIVERPSWGITWANANDFEKILSSDEFKDFYSTLYSGASQIIVNIIFLARGIVSYGKDYFVKNGRA